MHNLDLEHARDQSVQNFHQLPIGYVIDTQGVWSLIFNIFWNILNAESQALP